MNLKSLLITVIIVSNIVAGNENRYVEDLNSKNSISVILNNFIDKFSNTFGLTRNTTNDKHVKYILMQKYTHYEVSTELKYGNETFSPYTFFFNEDFSLISFEPTSFRLRLNDSRSHKEECNQAWKGYFYYYKLLSPITKLCKLAEIKHFPFPDITLENEYYSVRYNTALVGRDPYVTFLLDKKFRLIMVYFGC